MKYKYIGFPMKDGCHVYGADLGIEILNKHVKIDTAVFISNIILQLSFNTFGIIDINNPNIIENVAV